MTRPLRFRPAPHRPNLTVAQILNWCDAFRERVGRWPTPANGARGLADTTWRALDECLRSGYRGLPPGSSLAQLLFRHRGRHMQFLPRLTPALILSWADAHHAHTGAWPNQHSGPITAAPEESWVAVNTALSVGQRGLPGGSSLAQLFQVRRGVRNPQARPRLQRWEILFWADAHHNRTGRWPTRGSGAIPQAPGETWAAVNSALKKGGRGLPGGHSLARLLDRRCRTPNVRPALTTELVLSWADAHHRRRGNWPTLNSGVIPESGRNLAGGGQGVAQGQPRAVGRFGAGALTRRGARGAQPQGPAALHGRRDPRVGRRSSRPDGELADPEVRPDLGRGG
jgi:hypothetical protein